MVQKKVYIIGPRDLSLSSMFAASADYRPVATPTDADILCFQGGADVNPKFYGEEKLGYTYIDPERDEEDLYYWDTYPEVPKVGICRGGQFLNVMSDGEMWQHVDNHESDHEATNLLTIPGSRYKMGTLVDVTSDHHQMMRPHPEYGEVLCISHKASDFRTASSSNANKVPEFDTEVVWYEHTKSLCFQPHPEYDRKYETRGYFFSLMKYFFG